MRLLLLAPSSSGGARATLCPRAPARAPRFNGSRHGDPKRLFHAIHFGRSLDKINAPLFAACFGAKMW